MRVDKYKSVLIGVVLIVVGIGVWQLKHRHVVSSPEVTAAVKPALTVELATPIAVQWPMTLTLNGSIYPWQEALVSAEISGLRIQQILADVGDHVSKGQPLVMLADETVQADLLKQMATVEKDKASLAEAKSNADRAREIQDSGALSTQKINEYLIAEQTARANLALSQAELENQKIRLRQTRVTAPDDGVISSRSANLGNVVSAGSELFRMVRQGRLEWRGEVNANQQTLLHPGQRVRLTVAENKSMNGQVRLISPTVDNNTRNALVYVDIPKDSAKPGMYIQGQVDVGQQNGLAVPLSAVTYRDGFAYVFIVQRASTQDVGKVMQRKVQTGRTRTDKIELLDGIDSSDSLVLSGGAFLNDGDTVKIVTPAKAGA